MKCSFKKNHNKTFSWNLRAKEYAVIRYWQVLVIKAGQPIHFFIFISKLLWKRSWLETLRTPCKHIYLIIKRIISNPLQIRNWHFESADHFYKSTTNIPPPSLITFPIFFSKFKKIQIKKIQCTSQSQSLWYVTSEIFIWPMCASFFSVTHILYASHWKMFGVCFL